MVTVSETEASQEDCTVSDAHAIPEHAVKFFRELRPMTGLYQCPQRERPHGGADRLCADIEQRECWHTGTTLGAQHWPQTPGDDAPQRQHCRQAAAAELQHHTARAVFNRILWSMRQGCRDTAALPWRFTDDFRTKRGESHNANGMVECQAGRAKSFQSQTPAAAIATAAVTQL